MLPPLKLFFTKRKKIYFLSNEFLIKDHGIGRAVFDDLPNSFQAFIDGKITGRIVVKISDD